MKFTESLYQRLIGPPIFAKISVDGGDLRIVAPAGVIGGDLLAEVRQNKAELISMLTAAHDPAPTPAARRYLLTIRHEGEERNISVTTGSEVCNKTGYRYDATEAEDIASFKRRWGNRLIKIQRK